ncbi:MAG: InlB B-repeat-containing protein [Firmicutes bacterium]|nr:InlB B-repeat-containing protein [Bacillota bacterium]
MKNLILRKNKFLLVVISLLIAFSMIALSLGNMRVRVVADDGNNEQPQYEQTQEQDLALVEMRIMNTMHFDNDLFFEAVDNDFLYLPGHIGTGNLSLTVTNINLIQFDEELRLFSAIICLFDLFAPHRNQLLNHGILTLTNTILNSENVRVGTVGWRIYLINRVVNLPTPIIPRGFEFGGWYFDEDFTEPFDGRVVTGDMDLHARFIPIVYSITFRLNGGTLPDDAPYSFTIEHGTILPIPTRSGHYFRGWYTNSGFSGQAVTEISEDSIGNRQFFARWEVMRFIVTFRVGGEIWQEIEVDYGTTLQQVFLTNPETGELVELFLDDVFLAAFSRGQAITSDIGLYVRFGEIQQNDLLWWQNWMVWTIVGLSLIIVAGAIAFVFTRKNKNIEK